MRILTISDQIELSLYHPSIRARLGRIDLVLSCGDLPFYYIDFVCSLLGAPCYYVFGNHAQGLEHSLYPPAPPSAGVNLDGRLVCERGLLIAGLEGARRYNNNPRFQYTDNEMWLKVISLIPQLLRARARYGRFLDILITHAPPLGIHDGPDRAHQGFSSFLAFMRWFRPRYLIHGHKHVYGRGEVTETRYHDTIVINTFGFRLIEIEQGACERALHVR
ncbi:MAG: metallophosphoesterase [Anaerolineae bacterium]|nr:metallophosphoesterase [Anaerolineae bacterium]MDW8100183.1 metallophosphoesterase [Anaerolineae bacterium]